MDTPIETLAFRHLRTGLYQRLTADLAGTLTVYPFFAPPEAVLPFVVISQYSSTPENTKGFPTTEATVTVELWADTTGADDIADGMDLVLASITRAQIPMPDGVSEVWGAGRTEIADLFSQWTGDQVILKGILKYTWRLQKA